jgi:ubiquinone/menaquinone biosynthesis C-methylase UbiE
VNIYATYVLPRLIHLGMRTRVATAERQRFIPLASGTVLEVGVGSGLNLPFYGPLVQKLYALDPSRELWAMARRRVREAPFPVEFLAASAEQIPLEDRSVDAVVTTWSLCTIPNPRQALTEMRRVLASEGQLIFVELEADRWRLSPQPPDRCADHRGRVRHHTDRAEVQPRTEAFDLLLQGLGRAPRVDERETHTPSPPLRDSLTGRAERLARQRGGQAYGASTCRISTET